MLQADGVEAQVLRKVLEEATEQRSHDREALYTNLQAVIHNAIQSAFRA